MSTEHSRTSDLERTLGLPAALTIGVGTMVGAGIFIFPGIAAGDAGPAAILSFLLAGSVALLVALSTAELATAMPESGGAYYFISRTFGPKVGALVGIGQWLGLVFASAFYLVGFAEYAIKLLREFDLSPGDRVPLIALGIALLLTLINLIGTRRAGTLQNYIVVSLVGILMLLFLYGLLQAAGITGKAQWPDTFAPNGISAVFPTTALIFTSYLGFVQIATVAGEIKEPHRNLPRALVGSVLIVMLLYVLALLVSTTVFSADRLAELGETAMVEVARSLAGNAGALAIMGAALLATLSSANASILSSSRAVYALGRDGMLPGQISRIHERFGTPHMALLAVGLPIAGLVLLGRLEVLAEVASLLHLVFYGLICISLLALRRRRPLWYAPTFYTPGAPLLPAIGALASFGLITLMQPLSLLIGGGIILASFAWYLSYARNADLQAPNPSHIIPSLREPRILLPVEVPDPSMPPAQLLRAFRRLKIFALGYKIVPEQTSPRQAGEESGGEEQKALEKLADQLSQRGLDVTSRLIFTPQLAPSIQDHIQELNCQAILTAKPLESLKRLLVPIYAPDQINLRMATILRELARSSHLPVSLLFLERERKEEEDVPEIKTLENMAIRRLVRSGLTQEQLRPTKVEVSSIVEAVTQIAGEGDLVIINESDSLDRETYFSDIHDDIKEAVPCPVLLVLRATSDSSKE